MKSFSALVALGLAFALALAFLATPGAAQAATLPQWKVGQEVAYGVNVPIGQELAPFIKEIRTDPSLANITTLNELNVTGSLDSWVDQQVTVATDTYYVLHTISASGLRLGFILNATFDNLPKAGNYTGNTTYGFCIPAAAPTTTGTLAVNLNLTALTTSDGTTNYAVSNLATMNDTTNVTVQLKASADLVNIPYETTNTTSCVTTVTYKTENLGITVNTQDLVRTLYSPALDFFHFPIVDNGSWSVYSNATFAGNFTGTIDVTGLSAHDEQQFFDNLTQAFQSIPGLAVSGLDHFPIDLSQISVTDLGVNIFDHGVLHDSPPYPIVMHLRAKEGNMTLADGQFHEVFYIFNDAGSGTDCPLLTEAAIYSPTYPAPGQGMIVGYSEITCSGGIVQPVFELAPTPPATARDKIKNTETTYQVFPPAQSNTLADFFFQAPYWGLLIVAAVVIVGAALVLTMRRRRHRASPPPPPAPPPGTP